MFRESLTEKAFEQISEGVKEGSGRFLREEGSRWRTNKLLGRDTLDLLGQQHGGLGREDKENSAGGARKWWLKTTEGLPLV